LAKGGSLRNRSVHDDRSRIVRARIGTVAAARPSRKMITVRRACPDTDVSALGSPAAGGSDRATRAGIHGQIILSREPRHVTRVRSRGDRVGSSRLRNYLGRAKIDSERHDYQEAQTKLRRAIEILESLAQSETQIRTALADSYADLDAVLSASGDDPKAIDYLQKAIRIQEELSQQSDTRQLNNALKISHERLATARRKLTQR
jgi:hypothetical protein